MKFTGRCGRVWRKLVLGLIAVLVSGGAIGWLALPAIVKSRLTDYTGCPVEARVLELNPFTGALRVEGFRLQNPAGYPVPDFVAVTLLDVHVRPMSLTGGVIEIPRLHFDLEKITVVTNAAGDTNTLAVRERVQARQSTGAAEPTRQVHIGELVVKLGRIEILDYSHGGAEPVRRTLALDVNRRFTDVREPRVVVQALVADFARVKAVELLGGLGELVPGEFGEALGGVMRGAGDLLWRGGPLGDKAGEGLKKLIDSLPGGAKP